MKKAEKLQNIFICTCFSLMLIGFLIGTLGNEKVGMVFVQISAVFAFLSLFVMFYIKLGGKK